MVRKLASRLCRSWAGSVYAGFVPVEPGVPDGAASFVEDLWRVAPVRVALATTLGALLVCFSPVFVIGRPTLFHRLPAEQQDRLLERLSNVRAFPIRLWVFGVKNMALVAVLRDPACRRALHLDPGP